MESEARLTTAEAAKLASVTPSTIKRWADEGRLAPLRTAGGHRRFAQRERERFLREQAQPDPPLEAAELSPWLRCLLGGLRHELDSKLLEARSRLGSWCEVADMLGPVLTGLGDAWAEGHVCVAEEHAASEALVRALARIGDSLPSRISGPVCALACAPGDEHSLGLSLADLCLREIGWVPLFLGRCTPLSELVALARSGRIALLALSASVYSRDRAALRRDVQALSRACEPSGVGLVLGGGGAFPERLPSCAVRMTSFVAFREYVSGRMPDGRSVAQPATNGRMSPRRP